MLGQPDFLAIFPEIVRALLAREPEVSYDEIAPGREVLAREYQQQAKAAGFRTDIASTIAFDLIVGSQINHILATGQPPTPEMADQLTRVIVAGLRAPARAGGSRSRSTVAGGRLADEAR